ncbi:TPA: 2-oxoglutarate and iron-dependent oxygenase domain-containing protein, partial [Pseudomonas aeruginosa]
MAHAQLAPSPLEASQATTLPVIDISGLRSASLIERTRVSQQIGQACRDKGFFYVIGHGVPAALQQQVIDQAATLFALPPEEKRKVDKSLSMANRGYEPLRNQVLEAGAPPDVKEGFYIGQDKPLDHPDV